MSNGNPTELEIVFENHYSNLCFYANSFVRDFETSRDLVQDVFLKLWEKKKFLPDWQELEPYLYRSVKNRSLDYLKHNSAKNKYRSQILQLVAQETTEFCDPAEQEEIISCIENAIESLPQLTKKIFNLSRNHGRKYNEIAQELGISVKTVEAHISKALKILRVQLSDYLPQTILAIILEKFI